MFGLKVQAYFGYKYILAMLSIATERQSKHHMQSIHASGNAADGLQYCQSTLYVAQSGNGRYRTIQAAIDSVPSGNTRWICIWISDGTYREKVEIPREKPYIYLQGQSEDKTIVVWDDHDNIEICATFTSKADNIMAKSITFINSYNYPLNNNNNRVTQALAARLEGDKLAFVRCRFVGFQDTLWDVSGRHYFYGCTIQGAVDFIFGSGQSIYEQCKISTVAGTLGHAIGYITAQGREHPDEPNGFVFKSCEVYGIGRVFLGRAWREYARVIFYNTSMSNVVIPKGWDPWHSKGKENLLTFAEIECYGPGADTSSRVSWESKRINNLMEFTKLSYIDNEGWLSSVLPQLVNN